MSQDFKAFSAGRRRLLQAILGGPMMLPLLAQAAVFKKKIAAPAGGEAIVSAGSGRAPERIILAWTGDPARTQAVTWRTALLVPKPLAQIAPLSDDPEFGKTASLVTGDTVSRPLESGKLTTNHYRVNFTGLEPGRGYCYRVGDGSAWSEWNTFRTASGKPEPFRFLYLGDEQVDLRVRWSRAIRKAYAAAPDARFMIHAGDLVNDGYVDSLWGEWCEALGFISAMVPSLPTPGNHDLHHPLLTLGSKSLEICDLWHQQFTLPANGPAGCDLLRDRAYSMDYQGVRFISVDANFYVNGRLSGAKKEAADKQLTWLEGLLRDNPNRWTIVFHHQPVYSVGSGRDNVELREALRPLYDKYRVDLVLQGHDHYYGRTHKLAGDRIVAPSAPGTVYAVSVSGPKMYARNPKFEKLMAKMQGNTQMYQVIEAAPDRLAFKAYGISGALIDAFELRKDPAGASTLVEGAA